MVDTMAADTLAPRTARLSAALTQEVGPCFSKRKDFNQKHHLSAKPISNMQDIEISWKKLTPKRHISLTVPKFQYFK